MAVSIDTDFEANIPQPSDALFPPAVFGASRKHSLTVAGHPTSIRIEPLFWDALVAEAQTLNLPISAVVAEIDAARLAQDPAPNLASAIRLWLFSRAIGWAAKPGNPRVS